MGRSTTFLHKRVCLVRWFLRFVIWFSSRHHCTNQYRWIEFNALAKELLTNDYAYKERQSVELLNDYIAETRKELVFDGHRWRRRYA